MIGINDRRDDWFIFLKPFDETILYCDTRNRKNEWMKNGTGQWISLQINE